MMRSKFEMVHQWSLSVLLGVVVAALQSSAAQGSASVFSGDGKEQVRSALNLSDVDIQRIWVERMVDVGSDEIRVQVSLDGVLHTLEMWPWSMRGDGFAVLIDSGNGLIESSSRTFEMTTYRGSVDGEGESQVVGSYWQGKLYASVYGADGHVWRIQPVIDIVGGTDTGIVAVYRDDQVLPEPYVCGTGPEHVVTEVSGEPVFVDRSGTCIPLCELALDTDYEFYQKFSANADPLGAMVADMERIINEVDFVLQRDGGVATKVVSLTARTSESDPYSSTTTAGTLLDEMTALWSGIPQNTIQRDLVHLFTGRILSSNVLGIAYLGVVCNTPYMTGLARSLFTTTLTRRILVSAHEIGHGWSSPHDNQTGSECGSTPDGYIMNPSVGTQALQYSPCSISKITSHRDTRACIPATMQGPQVRNDTYRTLTGVLVDCDVLNNDTSNCGDITLSLPQTSSAGGGTLSLMPGVGPRGRSIVRYTSAAGYAGTDTFTYRVDNSAGSTTGNVSVFVDALREADIKIRVSSGLDVKYFSTPSTLKALPDFSTMLPYLTTTVVNINVILTTGNFHTSLRADNVGAVYTGALDVTTAGLYTFYLESDEGSRLYIGNQLVVDNDGLHRIQEGSGTIALGVGKHSIRIEYFEQASEAGLIARYAGPGITKQVVPTLAWFRPQPCIADFDNNYNVQVADIFAYLNAWFAQFGTCTSNCSADLNGGGVDVSDIFTFLNAWFLGCN